MADLGLDLKNKSDDFSASSQSIINYGNNKNSYIISRIYNGI